MPSPPLLLAVGVDAGGTRSAAHVRGGSEVRVVIGPSAQATRDGAEAAARVVAKLVREACAAFGGARLGSLAVGLAGAGSPDVQAAVTTALRVALGDALPLDVPLDVTHDGEMALDAAWGEASGAVLVAGTGSVVLARTHEGEVLRVGGWGPALGDDGSGTALGRAALRAALAVRDGGPPTTLADHLAEHYGLSDAPTLVAAAHDAGASLARFAPALLAEAGADDWVATATLAREVNALAQQAGWLATRADGAVEPRLALVGGLAREPVYATALRDALDRHLPGWEVASEVVDPAAGALARAERLADGRVA